ncbi:oligosaccharide flippase family protein [Elizabethkingia argenteiflava]|uniref:oligosaccharide flippase family protein n=1 Tax=Elizabethkingia argenteiflava TaxID=2681556 RepID=UPI001FCEBC09|nr:oligosaccharide flippase family protein [Elizabethkingia argenteiflava]
MISIKPIYLRYKTIIDNFFSLIVLNVVNYVFPIIIIPILMKRLGVEVYGKYIFAFTILNYLNLLVQYGFNFSATHKIAKYQYNREIISDTYTSISIIRIAFSIIVTTLLLGAGFFMDDLVLYLLGIGIYFGQGIIPVWLFQGLEKMKYITLVNTLVRLLAFIAIFFLIQQSSDVNKLMLIQTLSFIIGGIASLVLVKYELKINFVKPSLQSIILNLKEGWSLFLSTIGMNLYRESNVIILGLVAGYSTVGLYSPAEKLIKGIQSFTNIMVTALYPHFSKRMKDNQSQYIGDFFKIAQWLWILFSIGTVAIIFSSTMIIDLYIGKGHTTTIIDFRILSLVILFGGLNYYYGIVGLVNLNKKTLFNRLVWISGMIGMIMSFILSYYMKDIGAAISMVFAEGLLLYLIMKKIKVEIS